MKEAAERRDRTVGTRINQENGRTAERQAV
jgi:hypothetical protein